MKMTSARRTFWQALEDTPGCRAVGMEWRARMGDEYVGAGTFLRPIQELATSHPCTAEPDCGCYHDVVHHGPNDIVAVCHCGRGCETFPLKRSDIAVLELDREALDRAVAKAFGLFGGPDTSLGLPGTTSVGVLSPHAGFRFPLYLTICHEPSEFSALVDGLIARTDAAFVLLAPTREMCTEQTEQRLVARRAAFLSLSESAEISEGPGICLRHPRDALLARFLSANAPSSEETDSMPHFLTPPEARWRDVEIRLTDGQTASIRVMGASMVCNYAEMGMVDRRNGNPTLQWDLLKDMAEGLGTLDWGSRKASRKNQKRRERLAADLRAFFRIEGDPIALTPDGKGFRTLFRLTPRS